MSYNKTVWEDGMIIEADSLNNIESGIEAINTYVEGAKPKIDLIDTINDSVYHTNSTLGHLTVGTTELSPNYNTMDLGSEEKKFKNLYLSSRAYIGNASVLNASSANDYAYLDIRTNDNSSRIGYIGRGMEANPGIQVRAEQGDLGLYSVGENNVFIGGTSAYVYTHFGSKDWRLAPKTELTGKVNLGSDLERWKELYLKTNPNVSSDRNLKENIVYLNDKKTKEDILTVDEMYDFVKDELKLTKYNYINKDSKSQDDHKDIIGFIAQDVAENEKVGKVLLTQDEEGVYGYDTGTYTNILAGALQKALNKIDDLEARIIELENK